MNETVIAIRTSECGACHRHDSVIMTREELKTRIDMSDSDRGSYILKHNGHDRIIHFDEDGVYVGETIVHPEDND